MHVKKWLDYPDSILSSVEINSLDLDFLFELFDKFKARFEVPLFYWNLGYEQIQKILINKELECIEAIPSLSFENSGGSNSILKFLLTSDKVQPGVYLLDDLCNFDGETLDIRRERESLICNIERRFLHSSNFVRIVLLGEYIQFSARLQARITSFKYPLPTSEEILELIKSVRGSIVTENGSFQLVELSEPIIEDDLFTFFENIDIDQISDDLDQLVSDKSFNNFSLLETKVTNSAIDSQLDFECSWVLEYLETEVLDLKLVNALKGLSFGEINNLLTFYKNETYELFIGEILKFKVERWQNLGLEFFADPDVPNAGGSDLLQEYLREVVVKLNEPSAKTYNLRPPKGMLFMGSPGTGKSLCAKLAAKSLGFPLLGLSLGNVIGSPNPDRTLAQILEVADCLGNCVVLADDFDKGFSGWEQGGVSRRLSQRLLTWMQEHTSNALFVATVNRIGLLPAEIKRRFDDGGIWFVDLPHSGAIKDIFLIHLRKYFADQFKEDPWDDRLWFKLIKEYQGCTPVEIANSVSRCAQNFYVSLSNADRKLAQASPVVTVEDLLFQLTQFQKASVRDSDELHAIRNKSYYARPASSPDNSQYSIGDQELFTFKTHELEERSSL